LLRRHVLFLRANKFPDFVTLQAPDPQIADVAVMIRGAGAAHINKQLGHGIEGYSCHANDRAKGVALDQSRYNLNPFIGA